MCTLVIHVDIPGVSFPTSSVVNKTTFILAPIEAPRQAAQPDRYSNVSPLHPVRTRPCHLKRLTSSVLIGSLISSWQRSLAGGERPRLPGQPLQSERPLAEVPWMLARTVTTQGPISRIGPPLAQDMWGLMVPPRRPDGSRLSEIATPPECLDS